MTEENKKLRLLLSELDKRTLKNYEGFLTTISTVIAEIFGEKSDFSKKEAILKSGEGIKGGIESVNGSYPKEKYEENRLQAYKDLLNDAIVAVELFGIEKKSDSKESENSKTLHIGTLSANCSVLNFGDMKDVTNSIDNSIKEIEKLIDEKASDDEAKELKESLSELKEYFLECQEENKLIKRPEVFKNLNNHIVKHGWFYGAVLQLIGTEAIKYLG